MKKFFHFDFHPKSIHLFQLIFPIVYPFAIRHQKISLPGEQAIDADLSHVYCSSEFGLAQKQIVTIAQNPFGKGGEVLPGQGIVGHVIQTIEPLIIEDTSLDSRYRVDDENRSSEISVPIIHNGELLGVLDSEHREKNFFTHQHLQVLITVAALVSNKIIAIESTQSLQKQKMELHYINEQLYKTRLEALRSQMNPNLIFNKKMVVGHY